MCVVPLCASWLSATQWQVQHLQSLLLRRPSTKGGYCKKKWLLRPVKLADPRKRHAFWCRMRERRPRLSLTPPRWCVGTRPSRDMRISRVALDTGVTHDSPIASRSRHPVGEHSKDLRKNAGHFKVMVEVSQGLETSGELQLLAPRTEERAPSVRSAPFGGHDET